MKSSNPQRFIFSQAGKLREFDCNDGQGPRLFLSEIELSSYDLEYVGQYYLGALEKTGVFLLIGKENQVTRPTFEGKVADLRAWLHKKQSDEYFELLSRASQLSTWNHQHRFCPQCATPLELHATDFAKVCSSCELAQYPRISPCVIMLVVKGDECLLAHARHYKDNMYSTLAGFIEPGESAEVAVAREVCEEVGVKISDPIYQFSQSWPFPHSFMVGFVAHWESGEIEPDLDEIEDAAWFSREQLKAEHKDFVLPPHFTISRRLIDLFIDGKV